MLSDIGDEHRMPIAVIKKKIEGPAAKNRIQIEPAIVRMHQVMNLLELLHLLVGHFFFHESIFLEKISQSPVSFEDHRHDF